MSVNISITKKYGDFFLDISFKTESKRIGILGASGSGKSLTLKSIAGIENPKKGRIITDDRLLFDSGKGLCLPPQKRRVGYLFQSLALFPNMTVYENIFTAAKGKKAQRLKKTDSIINKFSIGNLAGCLPSALSYGQSQRAALARIIASEPDVILLDEPFSALDIYNKEETCKSLMSMLEDFGGTVILVSHSIDEIYGLCDYLVIINDGRVIAAGNTYEIFKKPPDKISARLIGIKNISEALGISENVIHIKDWDIDITLKNRLETNVNAVALPSDSFSLKSGEIPLSVINPKITKTPYGCRMTFRPSQTASGELTIEISRMVFCSDTDKIPEKIFINEENLLIFNNN